MRSAGPDWARPAIARRVDPDHLGRDARYHAPVGHRAANHRTGRDHHVAADARARQHDRASPEPAARADADGGVHRHLPADRDVRVRVPVVLVGDVDVRAGEHVVPDHQRVVRDDVTAPADHATVPDLQHRHQAEVLARHHPGRQGHEGADERVLADRDPAFPEDRTGREGRHRAAAERGEPLPGRGIGSHCPGPLHRLPPPVRRPPSQLAEPGPRHDGPAFTGPRPKRPADRRRRRSRGPGCPAP